MEIYQFKRKVDWLYRNLDTFNGTDTILLLNVLATLAEEFDAVGASETTAVRKIT